MYVVVIFSALAILAFGMALNSLKNRLNDDEPDHIEEGILLKIKVPKNNDRGPLAAEMMFSALHGMLQEDNSRADLLSFEMVSTSEGISFYAFVPREVRRFVESQIYAQYPAAEIFVEEKDYTQGVEINPEQTNPPHVVGTEVILEREYFLPIKTFPNFEVDPLAAITSAVENLSEGEQAWLQVLVRPLPDGWQEPGYKYLEVLRSGQAPEERPLPVFLFDTLRESLQNFLRDLVGGIVLGPSAYMGREVGAAKEEKKQMTPEEKEEEQAIQQKLALLGFEANLRVIGVGESEEAAEQSVTALVAALKQFAHGSLNGFVRTEIVQQPEGLLQEYQQRSQPREKLNLFVLNTEELASIYHLPSEQVAVPNISYSHAKKAEPPLDLPVDAKLKFAQTLFRERTQEFGILRRDRRRHMHIIGKTGSGKTTLQRNMIIQDIRNGEGLAVIDPHGDLFNYILDYIPRERIDDVVIFDPSDLDYPVAMNLFELFSPDQKGPVASGLIDVFRKRFEFSWGPRMEHLLRNTFLTFLEIPNSTILGVLRILQDKSYRKYIVDLLDDPVLKEFWEVEYYNMSSNDRLATEAIAPIQNRLGPFLATPTIRNIVGQAKSTISLPSLMNEGKILLANLSKGKIGEDPSNLLGGFLMSRLWFAALTRASIPQEERRDFYVYVDEFQNFATTTFATILSEARKYRLSLVTANQFLSQLKTDGGRGSEVLDAIFGNVGTLISFAVGQDDARVLAHEFAPVFDESDLIAMEKYQINLKLMINLQQSRPFSATTLPPIGGASGIREEVIARSRANYARPREAVEAAIKRWTKRTFAPGQDREVVRKQREKMFNR